MQFNGGKFFIAYSTVADGNFSSEGTYDQWSECVRGISRGMAALATAADLLGSELPNELKYSTPSSFPRIPRQFRGLGTNLAAYFNEYLCKCLRTNTRGIRFYARIISLNRNIIRNMHKASIIVPELRILNPIFFFS